jgi:hypothetical protein
MYATPHPEFLTRVQIVVVPAPDAVSRSAAAGPRADSGALSLRHFGLLLDVLRDDGIVALDGGVDAEEARDLTRRVRGLRDPQAMRRLAALGCHLASGGDRCDAAVVFVEEPRIDLRARLTSAQLDAYCVRGADVRALGRYRTDRDAVNDIWTASAARCPN